MIIDKIENSHLYKNISERISKSFEYIRTTDLKNIQPGKYEINGENIFALVSEYKTKSEQEGKLEAHRKYIDVQYVISGEEQMGYIPLGQQQILEPYKEENDIVFYTGNKSFTKVSSRMFAIFFPEDVHMPGITTGKISDVKKLVIKVRTT
ncbi:MAG: YhcH/YjgK/YiaL family protein [Ignavibacteriaceae bacterium]|nr:YhcH/YjgK/YiaL family protein [Ignavibacteriaceae bacterium]